MNETNRSALILERALKEHPDRLMPWGYSNSLAREFGVSRQHAHVVLMTNGFTVRRPEYANCASCGGLRRVSVLRDGRCARCSVERVTLTCATCGVSFERSAAEHRRSMSKTMTGLSFCGRQCFGSFVGTNYGAGRKKSAE